MSATIARTLPEITDEQMRQGLGATRMYTLLVLHKGPAYGTPGADKIIWEHGRRNFALRAAGLMPLVCPVNDGSDMAGIGIFDAEPGDVERIYADDPAIQAGVLTLEVHAARGFPGSTLPA